MGLNIISVKVLRHPNTQVSAVLLVNGARFFSRALTT